ncbi:MAG: type 2 isopentenyl-diphosphate Delta-isomerase [Alphaproteobacteria bacterium]|nr:type 2 isopentenyl-diphosphate Delta-isomerase [Alphaproteobacteria bacterium]
MTEIEQRKIEHLDVVMSGAANSKNATTGFELVRFEHNALPELELDAVDLSVPFLGRMMTAPLLISSMTGGPRLAAMMNRHIAEACGEVGIGFGVGSQRIALEGGATAGFGKELRAAAGDVPILANFGAAQLRTWDGTEMARRAVEMISADALIIHLNPLQEALQPDGDRNWTGILGAIEALCRQCEFPIVVKEVGAGISPSNAQRLVDAGVAVIDVAGVGGTSWAAVEAARSRSEREQRLAEAFRDWGIPTAEAVAGVRRQCPGTTVIASGGIRDGIDCAKAIRLGADVVGLAGGVLQAAADDTVALVDQIAAVVKQLRIVCFCTGSRDLAQLRVAALAEKPGYVT